MLLKSTILQCIKSEILSTLNDSSFLIVPLASIVNTEEMLNTKTLQYLPKKTTCIIQKREKEKAHLRPKLHVLSNNMLSHTFNLLKQAADMFWEFDIFISYFYCKIKRSQRSQDCNLQHNPHNVDIIIAQDCVLLKCLQQMQIGDNYLFFPGSLSF